MGNDIEIHAGLVAQLIRTQFPEWSDLQIRPVEPGGWDNRMFRLGSRMVVRLPSAEAYAAQVEKEQRWLPRLAPHLSVPIPAPLRVGQPGPEYSWSWSVYGWLEGEPVSAVRFAEPTTLAEDLAAFLVELRSLDASNGPLAGPHNFHRGGSLRVYDEETRQAIVALEAEINAPTATELWEEALSTDWERAPVWVHGDVAAGNLLVVGERLSAVIDFGCLGVGDPACDLVMAWTFFDAIGRERFKAAVGLDPATWQRARGWALWKALITLARCRRDDATEAEKQRQILGAVLTQA